MDQFTIAHGTKCYHDPAVRKCHVFWTGATADKYGRRFEPPTDDEARLDLQIFFAKREVSAAEEGFNAVKKAVLAGRPPAAAWDTWEFGQPPVDNGDNVSPPGKITLEYLKQIHAERVTRLAKLQAEYDALPSVAAEKRRLAWARIAEQQQSEVLGRLGDSIRQITL